MQPTIIHEIESILQKAFNPSHLEVINETPNHNVSQDHVSHLKVIMVSEHFSDLSLVQRHRAIMGSLASYFEQDLHALALKAYTSDEWAKKTKGNLDSPPCRGGAKLEHPGTNPID